MAAIDPPTGEVLEFLDTSRRWYRLLFNALHSFDCPWLLRHRPSRDIVVITLCTLGLALSVTAGGDRLASAPDYEKHRLT